MVLAKDKLYWYIRRLFRMQLGEIPYRMKQSIFKRADRFYYGGFRVLNKIEDGAIEFERFDRIFSHVCREEFARRYSTEKSELMRTADNILENKFNVFGVPIDFGASIDWHLDVKTKRRWPLKFWGDIDARDGFSIGGPKFVWEVNRLCFLTTLGLAFWVSKNDKYSKKLLYILKDWIDGNPYPNGINWYSSIECGLRLVNLVLAIALLKDYCWTSNELDLLNEFVWLHARHVYRYQSKYSSKNNHCIAEGLGLFLAGMYFKHLSKASEWFECGKRIMESEVSIQIFEDGGSIECTTSYLSFVFDLFLLFRIVCVKENISYVKDLDERLEKICEFIFDLADKKYNIPNIGDEDGATIGSFGVDSKENLNFILNVGAVLYNKRGYSRRKNVQLKSYFLLGHLHDENNTLKNNDGNILGNVHGTKWDSKLFEHSGLGVTKKQEKDKEIHFVFNCSPLGMPPLFAHGHLDALSFTLSIDGNEIFIDPGTYLYHSGGVWRRYFRSTAAHNTIRVNRCDFTEQVGDFMYGKPYNVTKFKMTNNMANEVKWVGSHNAYERLKPPVSHTREVIFSKEFSGFEIIDMLSSKKEFFVEQFFHLHPSCDVDVDSEGIHIGRENTGISIVIDERLEMEIFRGSDDPLLGWYSQEFNQLEKTNTLVCSGLVKGDAKLRTLICI